MFYRKHFFLITKHTHFKDFVIRSFCLQKVKFLKQTSIVCNLCFWVKIKIFKIKMRRFCEFLWPRRFFKVAIFCQKILVIAISFLPNSVFKEIYNFAPKIIYSYQNTSNVFLTVKDNISNFCVENFVSVANLYFFAVKNGF